MIKALLVNADAGKPRCSMYQAGLAVRDALDHSKNIGIYYVEASGDSWLPINLANSADLVIFNYHPATMGGFSSVFLDSIKTPKMGIIWDMMREPWAYSGYKGFDFIGIPAPNMETDDPKVCILPRIIHPYKSEKIYRSVSLDKPIISTFGFPAEYKNMLGIVDAINEEFDEATFRIKYAMGDHTPSSYEPFPKHIYDECARRAKPGVRVEFRADYMEMADLIDWLAESDLNIFLYGPERDQDVEVRMPTSVDQAIASRRSLALSNSRCLDHIWPMLGRYPDQTLFELLPNGKFVEALANQWSPENFASVLDEFLCNTL